MKMSDIIELSETDLVKKIALAEQDQINVKMDLVSNDLKDTSKIKKNRRDIARLKTVLSRKKGENRAR